MATYINGVTDLQANVPFYQPDYQFLQQQQQKADSSYQQGLDEIKSDYSSILSSQVTGEMATKVKEQYVKNAQDSLKKLSSSDLSLPQNVQQAEAVFAPFWSDKMLLRNIHGTQALQSAEGEYSSYLNSTDKEKRALANPTSLEDIQWSKQELGALPWDAGSYDNFRPVGFTPVHDLNAKANKAWDDLKLKGVITTTSDGMTMAETVNGPMSKEAYTTFWLSQNGGPEYDAQFQMFARVDNHRKVASIKQQYPGIDDNTAKQYVAQDYINQKADSYHGAINAYTKVLDEADEEYRRLVPDPNQELDPATAQKANAALQRQQSAQARVNDYVNEFTKELGYNPKTGQVDTNSLAYQKMYQNMATRPVDYMSDVLKYKQAGDWAAGVASISSVTKKIDPTWEPQMKHQEKMAELSLTAEKNSITEQNHDWQHFDRLAKQFGIEQAKQLTGITDVSGYSTWQTNGGTNAPGTIDVTSGYVQQNDLTNVAKKDIPLDVLQNQLESLHQNIRGSVYSINGVAGQVLSTAALGESIGLDGNETAQVIKWAQAGFGGKQPTTEQEVILDKVKGILKSNGVTTDFKGPEGLMPALTELIPKVLDKYRASNRPEDTNKIIALNGIYKNITHSLATYNANTQAFDTAVTAKIVSDPKYKALVNPGDPKNGIAPHQWTLDEMAPHFPKLTVQDEKGTQKVISPKEFAEAYRNGKFDIQGTDLIINDEKFRPVQVGDKPTDDGYFMTKDFIGSHIPTSWRAHATNVNQELRTILNGGFETKYNNGKGGDPIRTFTTGYKVAKGSVIDMFGDAKKLPELLRDAGKEVAPSLQGIQNGIVGSTINYDLTNDQDKSQQATGVRMVQDAFFSGNRDGLYIDGKPLTDDKTIRAITDIVGKKDIEHVFGVASYHTVGPNGKPSVKLVFRPDKAGKEEVAGTKLADLADNSEVYIDIKPDATSPVLQTLMKQKQEMFVYGDLLYNDKIIQSDLIENSFGFQYTITPGSKDNSGKAINATISIKYNEYDEKTGEFIKDTRGVVSTKSYVEEVPLMSGTNAVNPDELVQKINNAMGDYLMRMGNAKQSYLQRQKANGTTGVTGAQLLKQYQLQ